MNTEGEIVFLRTYKDFIFHFNMLDRNMGYCLRYCISRRGSGSPEKWLLANFDSKLKKIIALAKEFDVSKEFDSWHQRVKKTRHLRNVVSHGHWEWKEWLSNPIHYNAPDLKNGEGTFSNKEFSRKLTQLKRVANDFNDLRTLLEKASYGLTQPAAGGDATR